MAARMARTADANDHLKPGTPRIQNVVNSPMTPLTVNSQPNKIASANVVNGGTVTAISPRISKPAPSPR